jgi:hypothetical protein
MRNDFAVFILSHGRADRVYTLDTLLKQGYMGRWYIIIDNEDGQAEEYFSRFGKENVIMFDKSEWRNKVKTLDNFKEPDKIVLYARNACFDIAKKLGLRYFAEFDDDYKTFRVRFIVKSKDREASIRNLDEVFEMVLRLLDNTNIDCVAFAQGGDYIGGKDNEILVKGFKRKAMNTFFFKTDQPFEFIGRINEDANAYVYFGNLGKIFLTIGNIYIKQIQTQKNKGGLTEAYLNLGTYIKSFYTVMLLPSAVKVSVVGNKYFRMHHKILWKYTVPNIVSDKYRRQGF